MTLDILRTCTPQSPALLSPARLLAILTFRLAVNDSPFSSLSRWPSPLSRVLCTVLRKLKSMSTVEDFMSRLGMYFAGSRMPEQDARTLWVCEQAMEQVRMAQRGHLYLGGFVWQIGQSCVRTGSWADISALPCLVGCPSTQQQNCHSLIDRSTSFLHSVASQSESRIQASGWIITSAAAEKEFLENQTTHLIPNLASHNGSLLEYSRLTLRRTD